MSLIDDRRRADRREPLGFTLIELIVVVAVLGILLAIAIPSYLQAAERARRGSCFSNQRNLIPAALLYCSDHGITDGVLNSEILCEEGYCTEEIAECPCSEHVDFDDYNITIVGGDIEAIECTVEGEEHRLDL